MELQLGLGLCSSASFRTKALDLNCYDCEAKDQEWFSRGSVGDFSAEKRCCSDAFEDENEPKTLPLLQWNNQPPSDEDDSEGLNKSCSLGYIKVDEEEDGILGWPPIKFKRKNHSYRNRNNRRIINGCVDCSGRSSNSMYVKVKVDGVGIARKIDLSRFDSFEMLKPTLLDMFEIYEDDSRSYKLTYQDTEGDWLLAEDISWRSFIMFVQRLRLIRRSN